MGKRDGRIDEYIAKQQDFAKPILRYLRDVVHQACPECQETLKWGMPSFMHHGILCGMAAFKAHATFGFWKHTLVVGKADADQRAMGSFGRLTSIEDLPSKRELLALIRKAATLNEEGVKAPAKTPRPKKAIAMPPAFRSALSKNKKARANYEAFPPSHKREYLEWIVEAKREETRDRRIAQAVTWIAGGKARNWKYM
ncbi:MAG TPA: YdeI/OmpD-associated family protein [Gemmatimonadaceae bacterium]|nr:YdeI/OmpD-associated family protein [Gemmatimonadaceae bacterium]